MQTHPRTTILTTSTDQRTAARHKIGNILNVTCASCACLSLGTENGLLTSVGIVLPAVFWWLLFRPGHPAVLFFGAMFQWAQCYSPVVSANMEGLLIDVQYNGASAELAVWLCYGSLLVLAVGMASYFKLRGKNMGDLHLANQSKELSLPRLFAFYVVGVFASAALVYISSRAGTLRQPILAFATIKWLPVFLLAWTTLQHRRDVSYLLIVVGFEIVLGFTGYFSTFKSILFLLIIVGLGTNIDRKIRMAPIAIAAFLCLFLASFWQSIKEDYRVFLNQGTGQQVISVSIPERLKFLATAALHTSPESLWEGVKSGVLRLGYVDYFGHALNHVPNNVGYQNGDLWIGALKHTFMPRFFFPGKPIINESARTTKFTGVMVAGMDQGTSVSIGYPGESYIDFGIPLMFIPIFMLGVFYAFVYEALSRDRHSLAGLGLATGVLLDFITNIGSSNIGIVGGLSTGLIAFKICGIFLVPRLWPLLLQKPQANV